MSTSQVTLTSDERDYLIDMLETQDETIRNDLKQEHSNEDRKNLEDQRLLISRLFAKI